MSLRFDAGRGLLKLRDGTLSGAAFADRAALLAAQLPERPSAVNLCERRDCFLLAFVAQLLRAQTCLLPPSRVAAVVDEVVAENPGAWRLDDAWVEAACASSTAFLTPVVEVPDERVVVIGYTSGSTGRPRPNPKTWGSFTASTARNVTNVLGSFPDDLRGLQPWIVATVPPQHMYGLEMSVLMPLLGGFGIHSAHPLYPADIAVALAGVPEPRVLVSTPVHLRALLESGVELPSIEVIVSATAPLSVELAHALEQRTGAVLLEFFGSTETCVIASRRTAADAAWRPYAGVALDPHDDGTRVSAPWFTADVELPDVLEVQADGHFVVRGRNADMVEVAGKRASLADLTRRLQAIEGVRDAVVFQPGEPGGVAVHRLAALAVAPGLTEAEILRRLAATVDAVFLPRPLLCVARLPRNDVGKLPRSALLDALKR